MPAQALNSQSAKVAPVSELPSVGDVTTRATSLAYDLITLAELQARLLYLDVREVGTRSAGAGVFLVAMLALMLSAVPVLLLGGADWLSAGMDLSPGTSKILVGGCAVAIAAATGWFAFKSLRKVVTVFGRSQQELNDNIEFIKSLVSSNGSSNGSPKKGFSRASAS